MSYTVEIFCRDERVGILTCPDLSASTLRSKTIDWVEFLKKNLTGFVSADLQDLKKFKYNWQIVSELKYALLGEYPAIELMLAPSDWRCFQKTCPSPSGFRQNQSVYRIDRLILVKVNRFHSFTLGVKRPYTNLPMEKIL